ncbi:hypothetical protein ACIBO9_37110 [Streptomyces prunicolor]|uniref:hypothetical protein n=1 Tax=Streptomyces prunicolor TaxID=67348 RepID=UPI0037D5B3ED
MGRLRGEFRGPRGRRLVKGALVFLTGPPLTAYRATKGRRPHKADRVLLTGLPLMECRVSKASRLLKAKAGRLVKVGRAFPMGRRLMGRRVSSAVVLR